MSKLNIYGIRGVSYEWLASHLSEINRITAIDGITDITSSCSSKTHEVLQGSVLGLLLFLLVVATDNALEFTLTLNVLPLWLGGLGRMRSFS